MQKKKIKIKSVLKIGDFVEIEDIDDTEDPGHGQAQGRGYCYMLYTTTMYSVTAVSQQRMTQQYAAHHQEGS